MNIKRIIAGGAGAAALTAAVGPMAFAATIGAGDQIQTRPSENQTAACSVAMTGTVDGQNALLTAGHCGKEGDVVYDSEGNRIGVFSFSKDTGTGMPMEFGKHDYAVILLDEGVDVTNTTSSRGAEPRVIQSFDTTTGFESFGKPVYKDGATSGRTTGFIIYDTGNETIATPFTIWGDSGGSLVDENGSSHGITSRATIFPFVPITTWQNTDAAMVDYNNETGKSFVMTPGTAPVEEEAPAPAPGSSIPALPSLANVTLEEVVPEVPATPVTPATPNWGSIEDLPGSSDVIGQISEGIESIPGSSVPTIPTPVVPEAPSVPMNLPTQADVVQQVENEYRNGMNTARGAVSQAGAVGVDTSVANQTLGTVDAQAGAVFSALK